MTPARPQIGSSGLDPKSRLDSDSRRKFVEFLFADETGSELLRMSDVRSRAQCSMRLVSIARNRPHLLENTELERLSLALGKDLGDAFRLLGRSRPGPDSGERSLPRPGPRRVTARDHLRKVISGSENGRYLVAFTVTDDCRAFRREMIDDAIVGQVAHPNRLSLLIQVPVPVDGGGSVIAPSAATRASASRVRRLSKALEGALAIRDEIRRRVSAGRRGPLGVGRVVVAALNPRKYADLGVVDVHPWAPNRVEHHGLVQYDYRVRSDSQMRSLWRFPSPSAEPAVQVYPEDGPDDPGDDEHFRDGLEAWRSGGDQGMDWTSISQGSTWWPIESRDVE